jgi:hypothetical protein
VVPPDSAFDKAAQWQIQWNNPDMSGLSDALLELDYSGDIGRLKSAGDLLDDDFYNGLPWQVGLRRFGTDVLSHALTLEVLPMPAVAPIYLDRPARAALRQARQHPELIRATIVPVYESIATPEHP